MSSPVLKKNCKTYKKKILTKCNILAHSKLRYNPIDNT